MRDPDYTHLHYKDSRRHAMLLDLIDPQSGPLRVIDQQGKELTKDELVKLLDEEIERG